MAKLILEHDLAEDEQMVFVHIPKTGGETLNHYVLPNMFMADEFYHVTDVTDIKNLENAGKKYRCYGGHLSCSSVLQSNLCAKPIFISILRDPARRLYSWYMFARNTLAKHDRYRDEGMVKSALSGAFREWVAILEVSRRLNLQSLMLARDPANMRTTLEDARQNLFRFPFFGITEKYKESLWLFSFVFGVIPVKDIPVFNKGRYSSEPSEEDLKLATSISAMDYALYDSACEEFARRYYAALETMMSRYPKGAAPWLTKAVKSAKTGGYAGLEALSGHEMEDAIFSLLELNYRRRYTERGATRVNRYHLDFEKPIDGRGWHYREFTEGERPHCYRWMGPFTESVLDIPLAPESGDYIIRIWKYCFHADIADSFALTVNGYPVSLSGDMNGVLEGRIPGRLVAENGTPFSRLSFRINRVLVPSETNISPMDHRPLGALIHRVKIHSAMEPD